MQVCVLGRTWSTYESNKQVTLTDIIIRYHLPPYLIVVFVNRRFFTIFSYFFFFYGILVGFFTCLQRVAIGVVIGVLQLLRLDRCLLPRGWEEWDAGDQTVVLLLRQVI